MPEIWYPKVKQPIMPKTKRERNQKLRLGARRWHRRNEAGIRIVTSNQLDYKFKHGAVLYKAAIDLECVTCCKRIKAHESFWRSWQHHGRFECLRCRPVAKY